MKKEFSKIMLSGVALAPLLCAAQPVRAQAQATSAPSASADTYLEEIVVTANKREEKLNSVGSTVTALSAQTLSEQRITSLENIAAVIPGLSFAHSTSNTPILTLRGVGFNSQALGAYPAVSLYTDQIPLPFPVLGSHAAYDLQRIEVLKGPQGTLFGENSTGGAINFIAAKPTPSFEAGGDISYGRFNDVQGNAYLSGPISETLRARVAGTFENSDGWQISDSRPYDRNGKTSYGAGRLIVDWDASDRIRFSLNVNGWIDKSQPQAPQFVALHPQIPATASVGEETAAFSLQGPRAADWSVVNPNTGDDPTPRTDRKLYQIGLRSDFDVTDNVTLTSLTSYVHFKQTQNQDYDGLPIDITDNHEIGNIKSFNQELRLANAPTAPLRWVLGANYEDSRTFNKQTTTFFDNSIVNAVGIDESFQYVAQNIRNIAGFGNIEYDLTSQLTAKAGIRYTHSRNASDLCVGDAGDGKNAALFNFFGSLTGIPFTPAQIGDCATLNGQGVPNIVPSHLVLTEHNVSWRGGLDYKLNAGTLLYANISRGYKAGSFPLVPATTVRQFRPVTQEVVTSYEAGIKTDLFDRHVHVNAAAFYYNYKNKQVLGRTTDPVFGPSNVLVNVPKSRIYGLEGDVTARPVQGLTLTGSATYLNSRILNFNSQDSYDALAGSPHDLSGNKLPLTAKFSYNFDAEYRWELAGGGKPFAGVTVSGQSSSDSTISGSSLVIPAGPSVRVLPGLVHPFITVPYATLDLRAGYEAPNGAWRVMAYGKNVLNKYYYNNIGDQAEFITRYAGMPATYGVTFGFKFK